MSAPTNAVERTYNARPDTLDFRDKIYVPNLYEVPIKITLNDYQAWEVPILDQGQEGACTGFGLATVANYLLRRRKVVADPNPVSARMLYEMARRYDEWPGEEYSGSSARGAMKGWHKHGICADEHWPYQAAAQNERLTEQRTSDALNRPLGAYYRVNHKDLVSMHTAMAEVGILYATATVHEGWEKVGADGLISFPEKTLGGHAFAIVAYDQNGFWIQNSWGPDWGKGGFAQISYDDWLTHGTDVWVARLGAPVMLYKPQSIAISNSASSGKSNAYAFADLRPHIISIGNDGKLNEGGSFGTSADEVRTIFQDDFLRVTQNWKKKRLLLYAHGGLVGEESAVQRLADYRAALMDAEVYPVSFIWHTDFWTTATNILQDALKRRRPEGILDASKDFMLDRLDDALEPVARMLMGKMQWDEMKENAFLATTKATGGARIALQEIAKLAKQTDLEIHVVGHSAGSIFHAPFIQALTNEFGLKIESCTLWAPACTVKLFKEAYVPALKAKKINRFALYTLTDQAEQDDHCARIYNKSLLYLVSNAFETKGRIPFFREGEPILGMAKFITKVLDKTDKNYFDQSLSDLFKAKNVDWVQSPNNESKDPKKRSTSLHHGDFDDDRPTVESTLARMLDSAKPEVKTELVFTRSASSNREKREQLMH